MKRTFQYRARLKPSTERKALKWLELCRQLYNSALEKRIIFWKNHQIALTCYDQINALPEFKDDHPEYKKVGSQVLQDVVERLDRSFQNFFRRVKHGDKKAGFPRFKSENRYNSFTLKQAGWKLSDNILHITNVGKFKLRLSRPIQGDIKTIMVIRKPSGKWFVSFSCDNVPEQRLPANDRSIGIDVGLKVLLADSDGNIVENPHHLKQSEEQLKVLSSNLQRKPKPSKRKTKVRLIRARAYEKLANQRKDFVNKLVRHYVDGYQTICIEDLDIVGMIKNSYRVLNKHILDASWGMFAERLIYKAVEAGRVVVAIDPKNTSKMCSQCSELVSKSLSDRMHECPRCGLILDRDINAARNILQLGLSQKVGICIQAVQAA